MNKWLENTKQWAEQEREKEAILVTSKLGWAASQLSTD